MQVYGRIGLVPDHRPWFPSVEASEFVAAKWMQFRTDRIWIISQVFTLEVNVSLILHDSNTNRNGYTLAIATQMLKTWNFTIPSAILPYHSYTVIPHSDPLRTQDG